MKQTCLLIMLGVVAVTTGAVLAAGTPTISRSVIAGGGGRIAAGDHTLSATIGQSMTGRTTAGSSDLCVGFWCGLGAEAGEDLPALSIAKSGPSEAEVGESITYAVAVTNTGSAVASSLVITDVLPPGAAFISASDGGAQTDGMVSWSASSLPEMGSLTRTFTVSATQTITNHDYGVSCAEGVSALGSVIVVTEIGGEGTEYKAYLPLIAR
jgi:uncharacterized repeat protein (TIGR01451 family)